jgi:hypothetical protein
MRTIKISTLALTLILSASISMAGIKGKKEKTNEPRAKKEMTQEDIFKKVNESFAKAAEVVVVEASQVNTSSIPDDTRKAIFKELSYPKFAQDERKEDFMVVSFTYDEDGYMKILSINSSDKELNPYIISKLENIRLRDGSVTIGKAYNAKFHFKLL